MEKSIAQLQADLCNRIRGEDDAGIMRRLRHLCEMETARAAVSQIVNLKPGDTWYDVNTDQEFTMTE